MPHIIRRMTQPSHDEWLHGVSSAPENYATQDLVSIVDEALELFLEHQDFSFAHQAFHAKDELLRRGETTQGNTVSKKIAKAQMTMLSKAVPMLAGTAHNMAFHHNESAYHKAHAPSMAHNNPY